MCSPHETESVQLPSLVAPYEYHMFTYTISSNSYICYLFCITVSPVDMVTRPFHVPPFSFGFRGMFDGCLFAFCFLLQDSLM